MENDDSIIPTHLSMPNLLLLTHLGVQARNQASSLTSTLNWFNSSRLSGSPSPHLNCHGLGAGHHYLWGRFPNGLLSPVLPYSNLLPQEKPEGYFRYEPSWFKIL